MRCGEDRKGKLEEHLALCGDSTGHPIDETEKQVRQEVSWIGCLEMKCFQTIVVRYHQDLVLGAKGL